MIDEANLHDLAWAVAHLRAHAEIDARPSIERAIKILDDSGVFAPVDELIETDHAIKNLAEDAGQAVFMAINGTKVPTRDPLLRLKHMAERSKR